LDKALHEKKEPKEGTLRQGVHLVMSCELYIDRGVVHEMKGNLEQAFDDFCKALGCDPDSDEKRKTDSLFEKVIKRNDRSAVAYYFRGGCYELKKDFDKAMADYATAIKRNSHYREAYQQRTSCYGRIKNTKSALRI